ncbi:hypothetical protein FSP39_003762 [Pinctada imbricata]|uniref:VWFA domain-containing protein n=1 Tax=Pinctada imbricata TaxID=66713 RepID=A0AA89BYK8_PINIB|nr:hypothetical protein FSP39_003762 [Pinctada imbricata]
MMSYRLVAFLSLFALGLSNTQKEGCKAQLDLCIVMDGSDSISKEDFQILRNLLGDLIDQLNIGPGQGRMGIVVYSRLLAMDVPLTFDKEVLKRMAADMPHPREGTNTHLGIQRMKEMFRDSNRPNVPKVGIVVTDGISKEQTLTAREANLTKALGVNMFSVGVGPPEFMDEEELDAIASYGDQVLMVDSFGTLAKEIGNLVKLICPGKAFLVFRKIKKNSF